MKLGIPRVRHAVDAVGLAALALMVAAAAFHLLVLQPLKARNAQLAERLSRQELRAEPAQPSSAAGKVDAVYRFLRKDGDVTDWLAKLYAIGSATGVQMKSASYRTRDTEARILRYEMVLPLAGTYPQIRDFLKRAMAEIPIMSVDQLTLKRENRDEGSVHAELRLTLHLVKP